MERSTIFNGQTHYFYGSLLLGSLKKMRRRVKSSAISSFISLISARNQWQAAGCKMCGQHIHCLPKNMIFLETPNAKPSIWTYTYFTNLAGWNFWRASPYTKHNSHPFIRICISKWSHYDSNLPSGNFGNQTSPRVDECPVYHEA